jgi:hypothetical protein
MLRLPAPEGQTFAKKINHSWGPETVCDHSRHAVTRADYYGNLGTDKPCHHFADQTRRTKT